jgi:AcrR family transcriptional regulator
MQDKRDKVLFTAERLFAERGFENTSVADICSAANVSKGLVYHHFKSKEEVLKELFEMTTKKMMAMNDDIAPVSQPKKRLKQLIEKFFRQLKEDKMCFQLNLNLMFQPSTRAVLSKEIGERSAALLSTLEALFTNINSENGKVMAYLFIAELDGIALDYLAIYDDYPLEEIKVQLLHKYELNNMNDE